MGQYGVIKKVSINNKSILTGTDGFSYSAYINFERKQDAALAVLALENAKVGNFTIKASFGTTKYCNSYMNGIICKNKECLYLHKQGEHELTVDKDEMAVDKKLFSDQLLKAVKIADLTCPTTRAALLTRNLAKSIFPNIESILSKQIVQVMTEQRLTGDVAKSSFSKLSDFIQAKSDDEVECLQNTSELLNSSEKALSTDETHRSEGLFVFTPKHRTRFQFEEVEEEEAIEVPSTMTELLSNYSNKYVFFIKNRDSIERDEIQKSISRFKTDEWLQDVNSIFIKLL